MPTLELTAWCVLLVSLAAAVRNDVAQHRIPNEVCAVILVSGIVWHSFNSGLQGALFSTGGALAGLAVLLPFYVLRGMGAGDVKLMAAAGSFLGPTGAALAAASTLVLGATFGVLLVAGNRIMSSGAAVTTADVLKQRFPYAAAIAGGTLILMWHQGHWTRLIAALTA